MQTIHQAQLPSPLMPTPTTIYETPPSGKYLQVIFHCGDGFISSIKTKRLICGPEEEYKLAYQRFMEWKSSSTEYAVYTLYAWDILPLPLELDTIFLIQNPRIYEHVRFSITQAVFEGMMPNPYIERGSKHLVVLKFDSQIPSIFSHLPEYEQYNYSISVGALGMCKWEDYPAIAESINRRNSLKALYGADYWKYEDAD